MLAVLTLSESSLYKNGARKIAEYASSTSLVASADNHVGSCPRFFDQGTHSMPYYINTQCSLRD